MYKNKILTILFFFLSFAAVSQDTCLTVNTTDSSLFYDIVPDTTIFSCCYSPPAKYYLDVNNDGQTDFTFTSYYRNYQMGSYGYSYIEGNNLNEILVNTTNNLIADTLNLNDSICLNGPWLNKGFFLDHSFFFSDPSLSYSHNEWNGLLDKYVGFKMKYYGQEILGWIKVYARSYSGDYLRIESYGLGNKITHVIDNNIVLFPNPTSEFININLLPNESINEVTIINSIGERIYHNTKDVRIIDLRIYPDGLYIIKITTNARTLSEKAIKYKRS